MEEADTGTSADTESVLKADEIPKSHTAAYENAAFVPDYLAGAVDSSNSFGHELQQYRLVSGNGSQHPPTAAAASSSTSNSAHNGRPESPQPDDSATELRLLSGGIRLPASSQTSNPTRALNPLTSTARLQSAGRLTVMPPETKLRLQRLLRQNAGVLRRDATSVLLGVYNVAPGQMSSKELDKRFSAVAMEMLREQEDRDLHPFGRGGRFEGVLYSRRVKVQVDHTKFLAWIVFASFILLTSAAIIFLAEMERRQKSQQQSLLSTTSSTIDGLLNSSNNTTS